MTNKRLPATGHRLPVFYLLITLLLLAYSCEESFDLNAPYKDITVIYGMIDPGEDTTFVKINKAFLGEGDVMEMVLIEDSSIYKNDLQASIEELENGSVINTYALDTITLTNKEEGLFYNPYQLVYYAPFQVIPEMQYKLRVNVAGNEVTGQTKVVNYFSISKPSAGSKYVQFKPGTKGSVEWSSAKNGKRYEVSIRFNFKELHQGSTDTVFRYADWYLGVLKSVSTNGGEEMVVEYSNDGFYTFLLDRVPYEDPAEEDKVTVRFTGTVDFRIASAAEDLNTYMEVNEPSNSIVQEKPEYSNLSNGIGLFSSRILNVREKELHLETVNEIKNLGLKFEY